MSGCFSNRAYHVGYTGKTTFDIKFQACTTGTGPMTVNHQPVCGRCTMPPLCFCSDGVGASRDHSTDPCPNGENVCVSCETTDYLLIGSQCEHRPPCHCVHGVDAAPIDADCSDPGDGTPELVYEDQCSSCDFGYELIGGRCELVDPSPSSSSSEDESLQNVSSNATATTSISNGTVESPIVNGIATGFRALGGNMWTCHEHCLRHSIRYSPYAVDRNAATQTLEQGCRGYDWDELTHTCWWYKGTVDRDTVGSVTGMSG